MSISFPIVKKPMVDSNCIIEGALFVKKDLGINMRSTESPLDADAASTSKQAVMKSTMAVAVSP